MSPFVGGAALLNTERIAVPVLVSGTDARDYLQRMVSGDLNRLSPDRGIPSTLMTGKGKLVAAFEVHALGDGFVLIAEEAARPGLLETLDRLIILEDVTLQWGSEVGETLSLQGPEASSILGAVTGRAELPDEEYSTVSLEWEGDRLTLFGRRRCRHGGWDILTANRNALEPKLRDAGAVDVSGEEAEAARIEAGIPRFGIDATSDHLAPEAGYENAISYDKGCYSGQEIVARIRTYGHVNRRLSRIRLEGAGVPKRGDEIRVAEKVVGHVTSAALSFDGHAVALGYVRFAHSEPGTEVRVMSGDQELTGCVEPSADPA
jgi:aminomethyltransferase